MKKRGQISIELVLTFGFALLAIIPLTILLYDHTSEGYEDVNNNQAGVIARRITDTANSIYYMGHPSSTTLKVYLPENIFNISMNGRELVFKLDSGNEIVATANVNLSGEINPSSGIKYIRISAMQQFVNITDEN